jgi:hypothetical protein
MKDRLTLPSGVCTECHNDKHAPMLGTCCDWFMRSSALAIGAPLTRALIDWGWRGIVCTSLVHESYASRMEEEEEEEEEEEQ